MRYPVCHIVTAGPCMGALDLEIEPGDLLIAADGGYSHCLEAGLQPDILVGDMDSLPEGMASSITCERIELPTDKDDTDTLSACKIGMIRGYSEFRIYAAFGGDVGHEIANIQTLGYLYNRFAHGVLYGDTQRAYLVAPEVSPARFEVPKGTRVSVFSLGESAEGVYERGLYWELSDAELSSSEPIGVSNKSVGEAFEVSVKEGRLLVIIGECPSSAK